MFVIPMHCTGKLYLPRVKLNAAIVPFTEELIGQFWMIMVVRVLIHVGSGTKLVRKFNLLYHLGSNIEVGSCPKGCNIVFSSSPICHLSTAAQSA
mgnify:CR=1 FL=1